MTRSSLSTRFTLILSGVFLVGIIFSGVAYWRTLQQRAQEEIASQGLLLIETMNAVRGYTTQNVRPLLADELTSSAEFISETVPASSRAQSSRISAASSIIPPIFTRKLH